jgi:hypothetical protein
MHDAQTNFAFLCKTLSSPTVQAKNVQQTTFSVKVKNDSAMLFMPLKSK